jgi:hypothetical protein
MGPRAGLGAVQQGKTSYPWWELNHGRPVRRHTDRAIPALFGLKQAKGLISGPSAKRTMDLLELNRDQLRWVVGLLTGHCHLKGHLFKVGLTDDPTCERCLEEDETATHILRDWEVIAYLIFRHLGQFFMKPSDYYDAPINRVLHFIRSVGLIKG